MKYYYHIFLVLLISLGNGNNWQVKAQNAQTDSLERLLQPTEKTQEQVNILNALGQSYESSKPSKALEYGQKALNLSREITFLAGEGVALRIMGNAYRLQGEYPTALEYLLEANKIFEKLEEKAQIATTLNAIGNVHFYQNDQERALKYYQEALLISEKLNDKQGIANALNNSGNIYFAQDNDEEALKNFEKALMLNQEIGNKNFAASNLRNIGAIYLQQKNYEKTLNYLEKALEVYQEINNKTAESATLNVIATVYMRMNNLLLALEYARKSLRIAKESGSKITVKDAYETLSEIFAKQGQWKEAFETYKLFTAYKDTLFNQENQERIYNLESSYQLEKQQNKIDLLNEQQRTQNIIQNALIVGLIFLVIGVLLVGGLAVSSYRSYQQKRNQAQILQKANEEIQHKNEILIEQKDIIEQKKKNIDSSIQYAKRIQTAVLPMREKIQEAFPNSFILLKPRDVVSGDFYWFTETSSTPIYKIDPITNISVLEGFETEKVIIAAVDSTGHGIPGAFMSLLGVSLLNQIVVEKNITDAAKILTALHNGIRETLKQDRNNNHDGMDLALCVIDKEKNVLEFAGAHNPLIYFKDGKLYELKGNPFGIGGYERGIERSFTKKIVSLNQIDCFYLFSDGYKDQFGGETGKKFMKSRFYQLLTEIHQEKMAEQKNLLEQRFRDWAGEEAQVDDILVIGVAL